jgi:hypothetical protein
MNQIQLKSDYKQIKIAILHENGLSDSSLADILVGLLCQGELESLNISRNEFG